jgi:choice-of-anchor A domain-containing protein
MVGHTTLRWIILALAIVPELHAMRRCKHKYPQLLKTVWNCNTWVAGDMVSNQGWGGTQGKVCVGGNFRATGYSVGDKLPQDRQCITNEYSLIVGGNLDWQTGRKYVLGHCIAGTAISPTYGPLYHPGCSEDRISDVSCIDQFNFAASFLDMQRLTNLLTDRSYYEKRMQGVSIVHPQYEASQLKITVSLNASTEAQLVLLPKSMLTKSNCEIQFLVSGDVDAIKLVVVQIDGDVSVPVRFGPGRITFGPSAEPVQATNLLHKLLWNLGSTRSMSIEGVDFPGSVLAPTTSLHQSSGMIRGQLIVGEYITEGSFIQVNLELLDIRFKDPLGWVL